MVGVYNDNLNDFTRKYFIKGNEHLIKDVNNFPLEYESIKNSLIEQLLVHDSITFKVYGENIPIAFLINTLGLKTVEALLEQKAINFVLWNSGVTYNVDNIPGIFPLQSFNFSSSVHIDPEESIMSGLKFLSNSYSRKIRRNITRKVIKNYKLPPKNLAEDAVRFGHEGYKDNLFTDLGLPMEKDIMDLNQQERKRLVNLATQCYDLTLLSTYQLNTYNSFDLLTLNRSEFQKLKDLNAIENVVDEIFRIEGVPTFSQLVNEGLFDVKDLPKIREGKNAEKFRAWIDSTSSHSDRYEITREYINTITNSKSILERPIGKLTRVLGVTALGGIIGSTVAGPIGALSGAVVGNTMDIGISLFDSYVLDNIFKGWTPKYYIDKQVRPLIKNQTI
ncbi:hypothetical protein M2M59_15340 [Rummeliibacillus sp. G93]|uniref:hypothetical protein n=1 Tax=Rummeliibacillus sp. G93 TaxID=2939494 RepID=UPI00201C2D4F|nr:hypothetical protein [Rummeliibacillus sp. G93]UQW97267.1 hypothetical protein M2M59_15340 [Rummeliibacillus sp. G93]